MEVFQVKRVLERMDRFTRLMHVSLGTGDDNRDQRIDLIHEMQHGPRASELDVEPLRSAFPVNAKMLRGDVRHLAVTHELDDDLLPRFWSAQDAGTKTGIRWEPRTEKNARSGVITVGERQQAFTISLHSIAGKSNVRCVSPIGQIDVEASTDEISRAGRALPVRICAVLDPRFRRYNLSAEADVLLSDDLHIDMERIEWFVRMTVRAADKLEDFSAELTSTPLLFRDELRQEPSVER